MSSTPQIASSTAAAALPTYLMSQMGESYAANRVLQDSMVSQQQKLNALSKRAIRNGYSVADSTLDVAYARRRTRWYMTVIMITLFVTICVLTPTALHRMDVMSAMAAYCVAGFFIVVYALAMLIFVRSMAIRRHNDWDRYYFRATGTVASAQQNAGGAGSGSCDV